MLGKIFSSPVFTWWNSATIGTRLFTSRKGVKVGEDEAGNLYYREKGGDRRWVIYKGGPVEASRVPPEWHAWLHRMVDDPPSEKPLKRQSWEKDHKPNLTGTDGAYFPPGSLWRASDRAATTGDYEAWKPE
ncbi:NADH:ubiquinone oxidoreductase subunit NDUFA12 [Yunchengibacter salinarum]|uniref:NADH:ubiquinone oxidoreductase subunit NDUFA12 n=1 Tax=Yunchengibacter salinarum TaxID=3133399 RepID=UPI0035B5A2EB